MTQVSWQLKRIFLIACYFKLNLFINAYAIIVSALSAVNFFFYLISIYILCNS